MESGTALYPSCRGCGARDFLLKPREHDPDQNELRCKACNSHIKWLPKAIQPKKRPPVMSAECSIEQVWEAAGNCCGHCGLSSKDIDFLGLQKTRQHVPPFKEGGHNGYFIPLCSWCQQDSATKMKRIEAMIDRLVKKFSM